MKKTIRIITFALLFTVTAWLLPSGTIPSSAATGVNVDSHSQAEIKSYFNKLYADHNFKIIYEKSPVTKGPDYKAGRLSNKTLNGAVSVLNGIRYIAGIPANVQLKEEYNQLAQAGALVNAVNDDMSHNPIKPKNMSQELYELGKKGCGSSNLSWGYNNLDDAVKGWVSDEDNVKGLDPGHRRWCLNPSMLYTGFGRVGIYSAMYAFDKSRDAEQYTGVAWPAQQMPTELFNTRAAWSISFGEDLTPSSISVILKRKSDEKTWNFSQKRADGQFLVSNFGYGEPGCVIFNPKEVGSYKAGDSYQVTIKDGTSLLADYTVTFFNITKVRQKITAKSCTKTYGDKAFSLSAKTNGGGKLSYKSNNSKVAVVNSTGEVTLKGPGKAVITITATATSDYKTTTKCITITVKPKKPVLKKAASTKRGTLNVKWKRDKKATGYQIVIAQNKEFNKGKKTALIKRNKTTSETFKNLNSQTYYYKIRSYKQTEKSKVYSTYSNVQKIRVK